MINVRYIVLFWLILCVRAEARVETTGVESSPPATAPTSAPASASGPLNPDRYIDVDQIVPGMPGYGLTVFQGDKIERFAVEVVSVMRNTQPGRDVIVVRCRDERFDKSKVVQGVSGSPVYFKDKMAGAMAFGWPLSEEPLYGVTPIRQMLQIQRSTGDEQSVAMATSTGFTFPKSLYSDMMRTKLIDDEQFARLVEASGLAAAESDGAAVGALQPLPMAMTLNGLGADSLRTIQRRIPQLNVLVGGPISRVAANASGGGENIPTMTLAPGGVMTIPLVTGDLEGSILGTVTEVVGNEVFGFGHPWNGRGPSRWPLAAGTIHTFVNRITTSFKLGQSGPILGTICTDETAGVYGRIGEVPDMIPVEIKIEWPYADFSRVFQLKIVQDQKINPLLMGLVTQALFQYKGELPQEHTVRYRVELRFDKVAPLRFENITTGGELMEIFDDIVVPLGLMLENPWQQVHLTGAKISATVRNQDITAQIRSSRIDKVYYQPGQTVNVQLELEPVRAAVRTYSLAFPLPADLPEGDYRLEVGAKDAYEMMLRQTQPHLFQAFNADNVRDILQRRLDIVRDKLYICMVLPDKTGLTLEDQSFPQIPSGKAMLLNDTVRHRATNTYQSMIYQTFPADFVPQGTETFKITVKKHFD